jgi:hypothetical protein
MLRFFVIITEKLGEAQPERNSPAPMLIATAREMTAPSLSHSRSKSVNSACPGKTRNQGRGEGREHSRTSASSHFPNPIPFSNRELSLLERGLSYCKQRKAALSNRELSTNQCRNFCVAISLHSSLNLSPIRTSHSFALTKEGSLATSHFSALARNHETARGTVGLWPTITFAAAFAAPKDARPEKFSALPNLNRQIHEYRNAVTCRKQTAAHCSNSQKFQKWMHAFSPFFPPARISPRTNAPAKTEL